MVKKLFKYEWKYYVRLLPVAYLILLTVAASNGIVRLISEHADGQTSEGMQLCIAVAQVMVNLTFGAAICAVAVFSFAVVLIRFYKHLFSAEGYLTLTLPVTPTQHLAVKTVSAVAVNVLTTIVAVLALGIGISFEEFAWVEEVYIDGTPLFTVVFFGVMLLRLWVATMAANTLRYYAFIALGQLFRKHRILAAVGLGTAYYFVKQVITTVLYVVLIIIDSLLPGDLWENGGFIGLVIVWTLLTAGWAVLEFLLIKWIISKKLDLE